MEKIRVLFIMKGLQYSGAEIVLERYLDGNQEIKPYFLLLKNNREIIEKLSKKFNAKDIFVAEMPNNLITNLFPVILSYLFRRKVMPIIKRVQPQSLYANNSEESIITCFAKKTEVPVIVHIHDMVSSFKNPVRRFGLKRSINKADKVITVSKAAKNELNCNNISVIYNGLNNKYLFNNNKKKGSYFSKDKFVNIGFVGSFTYRKGPDILIESIANLKNKFNIELSIAYNQMDQKLFSKCKKKYSNLIDQANFHENLTSNQIKEFYEKIDILVVPSRRDPLPTVIMEAMAHNCLIVGSNVDGIPEMINDEELLFNRTNPKDLSRVLVNLLRFDDKKVNNKIRNLKSILYYDFNDEIKKKRVNEIIKNLNSTQSKS